MALAYILFCVRFATLPCKYFQLNARYFNRDAGIFSKLGIDELIPAGVATRASRRRRAHAPQSYPVFVKPEWSQNARGVCRATPRPSCSAFGRTFASALAPGRPRDI